MGKTPFSSAPVLSSAVDEILLSAELKSPADADQEAMQSLDRLERESGAWQC